MAQPSEDVAPQVLVLDDALEALADDGGVHRPPELPLQEDRMPVVEDRHHAAPLAWRASAITRLVDLGVPPYLEKCARVASNDYEGFVLRR